MTSYFYYGSQPRGHYYYQRYNNLPYWYGYQYFDPYYRFAYWNNYKPPFRTYPGWQYVPHAWSGRNRFTQVNNVVCDQLTPQHYCPKNAQLKHFKDQKSGKDVSMCTFPGGAVESAAESMAQCQDPGNWSTESINQYNFPKL